MKGNKEKKEKKYSMTYVPVQMFVRISRQDNENSERALLVARREDGREFIFSYKCLDDYFDLTVCDFTPTLTANTAQDK